jgi:hypothetical protein
MVSLILIVFLIFLISKGHIPKADILFGVLIASQIPTFILFIQYYINDNKSEFSFEKSENKIVYCKGVKSCTYTFEQVKLIQLTGTASRLRKDGIPLFSTDAYFYYKFFFVDGNSIILTSLILNGKLINEANFRGIHFQKQRKFFSFLP